MQSIQSVRIIFNRRGILPHDPANVSDSGKTSHQFMDRNSGSGLVKNQGNITLWTVKQKVETSHQRADRSPQHWPSWYKGFSLTVKVWCRQFVCRNNAARPVWACLLHPCWFLPHIAVDTKPWSLTWTQWQLHLKWLLGFMECTWQKSLCYEKEKRWWKDVLSRLLC